MKFFEKIFSISLISLLLLSCGYTPLYKNQKNLDFSISVTNISGDRKINNLAKAKLKRYSLMEKEKNYNVVIDSEYSKTIVAKDTAGNVTDYKISVIISFDVTSEKFNKFFEFDESFNMKKLANKIEELDYEKNIKNNLVEIITQKLVAQLIMNR